MDCGLHQTATSPISIATAVVAGASALVYLRGWSRVRRWFPEFAAACRPGLFLAGLLLAWIVIGSPLSVLDHRLLTFHMLQHLVLMTIAAPLLLLARPGAAFLRGLSTPLRRAAFILLRSTPAVRLARALTNPAVCWLAGTGVVIAWHVPAAHELSMRSQPWHLVQHLTFLAGGLLFWWPVVDTSRAAERFLPAAPVYLFLATLPCDALSAFLAFCGRVVYPSHASAHASFALSALQDQQCAGALMWFWVTIAYLLPATAITLRLLWPRSREARVWSTR